MLCPLPLLVPLVELKGRRNISPTKARLGTLREALVTSSAGLLPSCCSLRELRSVYDLLEREHRRVTVNGLLGEMTNISDVIAVDQHSARPTALSAPS